MSGSGYYDEFEIEQRRKEEQERRKKDVEDIDEEINWAYSQMRIIEAWLEEAIERNETTLFGTDAKRVDKALIVTRTGLKMLKKVVKSRASRLDTSAWRNAISAPVDCVAGLARCCGREIARGHRGADQPRSDRGMDRPRRTGRNRRSMTRVWIAQCLCGPNRHAIVAAVAEADNQAAAEAIRAELIASVASMRSASVLNPWCGICGASEAGWRYEIGRTPYRSMAEAQPALAHTEAENAAAAAVFGSHGPKPPGRPN